jgi:hypothetical protein
MREISQFQPLKAATLMLLALFGTPKKQKALKN